MRRFVGVRALVVVGALCLCVPSALAENQPPAAPPPEQGATPPGTVTQPATPSPEQPQTAPNTETAGPDPMDVVVCKKEEATVGSRLGARKVCKTRRQWRDQQRDAISPDLPDGSMLPGPSGGL